MPSSGRRRKGPGPLTVPASYTGPAGVTGPGDLRVPPHREGYGSRVWRGDPRAAAGVLCLADAGPAMVLAACYRAPGEVGGDERRADRRVR
jgi:hypothetical protein